MKQALLLSGIMAGIGCVQADAVTPAKGKKFRMLFLLLPMIWAMVN